MVQRLTYRRRNSYNTKSNRVKIIKTPGGKLAYLHVGKKGTAPKCGDCAVTLQGLPALRPTAYKRLSHNQKRVNRAYGGSRCATCVRDRIVRAFLLEEQRIVKKVLKAKAGDTTKEESAAVPANAPVGKKGEKDKEVKEKAAPKKK